MDSRLLALLVLTGGHATLAVADPPGIPDDVANTLAIGDWDLRYTDQNPYMCTGDESLIPPNADRDFVDFDTARLMIQSVLGPLPGDLPIDSPASILAGYGALGFKAPSFSFDLGDDTELFAYDCAPGSPLDEDEECDNGSTNANYIRFPATRYCGVSEERIRFVMGHEIFHRIQGAYNGNDSRPWGSTAIEGTARMMEDHVFPDLDEAPTFVVSDAANYLQNPNRSFWDLGDRLGYQSVLGWKYAAEQYGSLTGEPASGADFIRRFWELAEASIDDPNTPRVMGETIKEYTGNALTRGDWLDAITEWFQDHAMTNLFRSFGNDLSRLPADVRARYTYRDEADGFGTRYADVTAQPLLVVGSGNPATGTATVQNFGAVNLVAAALDCGAGDIFGFRSIYDENTIDFANGYRVRYGVLGLREQEADFVVRGGGRDFAVAAPVSEGEFRELLVALSGGTFGGIVDYAATCGPGAMTITSPKTTDGQNFRAFVGPAGDGRQPLLISLRVTGPAELTDPIVKGLREEDFEVFVGTLGNGDDRALNLQLADVGESWLLTVFPPDKPATQLYDLHVRLGGAIVATEPAAVSYEERIVDEMLVLDTSGSMADPGSPTGGSKLSSAVAAATALTNRANARGRIGLVRFASSASVEEALDDVTVAQREEVIEALGVLTASGSTSIGDGLDRALSEFVSNGSTNQEDWALLLTDGRQNAGQDWDDVRAAYQLEGVHVWGWALGDDADAVLLQEIVEDTGGFLLPIDADPGELPDAPSPAGAPGTVVRGSVRSRQASPSRPTAFDPLPILMADAFLLGNEAAEGRERLWENTSTGSGTTLLPIDEGGIVGATFSFFWPSPDPAVAVELVDPDGQPITDGQNGNQVFTAQQSIVFQLPALAAGTWTINVTTADPAVPVLGVLAGRDQQAARLTVRFGGVNDEPAQAALGVRYLYGRSQPIVATLSDKAGPIPGVEIVADVAHPDGTSVALPLFDDGLHGDGQRDDGVYANRYRRTTGADFFPFGGSDGTYRVRVEASGTNNLTQIFTRIRRSAFVVAEINDPTPDTDGDTMPDRYETEVGCLDPLKDDGDVDHDNDLLSSFREWREGTNPCDPDTDAGGEIDGSELAAGRNPLAPTDDLLDPPVDPAVVQVIYEHVDERPDLVPRPGANLIRYPSAATWAQLEFYRATSRAGPYTRIASIDPRDGGNFFYDEPLVNGQTYWYYLQAVAADGSRSTPSHRFSGTPKADPIPPLGGIQINAGQGTTVSVNAFLTINGDADVTSMRIADTADALDGAPLVPFQTEVPWTLVPDPATGVAGVYLDLFDAAGNVSPATYFDDIEVLNFGNAGQVVGQVDLDGAEPGGVRISVIGSSTLTGGFTDPSGNFDFVLPPGTYTLRISRAGYAPEEVEITVNAAGTTNLGVISLSAAAVPTLPLWGLALLTALLLAARRRLMPQPADAAGRYVRNA